VWVICCGNQHHREHPAGRCSPVSVDGKWGYVDKTGSVVIKPQFDSGGQFSQGLAAVWDKASNKTGYIDTSGAMVILPRFRGANAFSEGLAAVDVGAGKTLSGASSTRPAVLLSPRSSRLFQNSPRALS